MGYLLKEGLKTLCGVNQWSYAVFWKIGCQNPKLLIWDECYYEPASCSGLPRNENPSAAFNDFNAPWNSPEASNTQAGDKVHLLVNKMMMDSHVNIVGEGLVGRVAFTGNHQWILSESYCGDFHPPEVAKEVCQQFSAGIQTVAVIPVLPHGVVQFGSTMTIMENLGFINDVTSLVLQLGYVSGALMSQNYEAKEHAPRIGVPVGSFTPGAFSLESNVANAPCSFDPFNYVNNISQRSLPLAEHIQNDQQSNGAARTSLPLMNGVAKAEVISSNSEIWSNQSNSLYMSRSTLSLPSSSLPPSNCSTVRGADQNEMFHKVEPPNSNSVDCFTSNSLAYSSGSKIHHMENKFGQIELHDCKKEMGRYTIQAHDTPLSQLSEHLNMAELIPGFAQDDRKQIFGGQTPYDDVCFQPESGDDLFDVLGADFKNKLFNDCWKSNESASSIQLKKSPASSEYNSAGKGNSESGIFSSAGTDHLLEAVVSKTQPYSKLSMDDNVSCRTTVTNTSSSSAPNTSLPYGRFGVSDHLKGDLFGVPKYLAKAGAMSSCSKEESRSYSQGSSIYGSQISSWMEKDQKATPSNSVSTGHSKKADESSKANRKRLKPGENPRPRPKDRQMIQDRVKELREIVPNGAKCSIDALLERTIKHMLFLQSVTKHADKLKQTGDSKIISNDGGLLLKDNFEGGATWAYEVGSQSMVCPIIVEDLNQPRQMLVEMLCEERGLFLEIADIIRGLGLTILKGVMETRNDKIWARFAVEANRDVTRMEIFISLVRLLEQSSKGTSKENLMAQQFHQVASVPLTASLQ